MVAKKNVGSHGPSFIAHGHVHVKTPQTSGDVQEVCDVSEAKLMRMRLVKSALFGCLHAR